MQFIKNGPDIPEPLLQAHEEGRVVFFCGAGISYPAGLPDFGGLVDQIYARIGTSRTAIEDQVYRKQQYDATLDLLERRVPGQRAAVRAELAEILKPKLRRKGATSTHAALLELARDRNHDLRLVTTNFDRIFEILLARTKPTVPSFAAPLLPIPKNNRWSGVVYLHGLLPKTPVEIELNRLVLSSGDFGLAYLTERWASRFVSELFRSYTVCFVGYSINDQVLRYMMDALAADRMLGESTPQAYAFGSYGTGEQTSARIEWEAKGVAPVLYEVTPGTLDHSPLHLSLKEWAAIYRDGVLGKERIVVQYAMAKPLASTKQDDFVGRLLWALSDQRALPAKRFAELDPAPPLDWLEPLTESRFGHGDLVRFGVQPDSKEDGKLSFSLLLRPTPYARAPWMSLGHRSDVAARWDEVMTQLARWLTRHLDDPKLILWVAKHGGELHPEFAWEITRALRVHSPSPLMQTLWRLALSGRLQVHSARFDLLDWRELFARNGLMPMLRLQLRDLLSPRVSLTEPFRGWEGDDQVEANKPTRIKDLVDWEIVLVSKYVHSALKDLSKDARWREALPELLSDSTTLLRDALDLMRELGGIEDRHDMSYMHQPSISEHPQNRDFHDWTALIDLARDAWLATAEKSPERARLEAERWLTIPYPLFRRLAFFAATGTRLITPQKALGWLLADEHWWLWSVETEREALRLLVALAPQLDAQDREVLEQAVLHGPPRVMFRDDTEPERLRQIFDREIWLRLAKCNAAGTKLSAVAAAKLDALSRQYPAWRTAEDERDEFPYWMGDGEDLRKFSATPKHRRDLVKWLQENSKTDAWHEDDWRERCKLDFRTTAWALLTLVQRRQWLTDRWREALQAWADEKLAARSWRYTGAALVLAPDDVAKELAHSLSWWLQAIAKSFDGNEAHFFTLIRRMLALHRDEGIEANDDPVSRAINHPVGHVTDAALRWWYRQELQDGHGLPDILKSIFTDVCDTDVASFVHGRVLLATHVIALFRVDEAWATQHLLPLFDWRRSLVEASAAWEGFLRSPRIYRPLMEAIKPQFLATAQHYAELGDHGDQYAALLTFAALEPGDTFSKSELAGATRALPADGLQGAAQALVRALEGAGEQRTEYWRNRVLPYLKSIWPKSREVITPTISESLGRLCVAAQEDFPEALREMKHWLQPVAHPNYLVHLLHESKLCARFPEEALVFLYAVIECNAQWPPGDLKECLDTIREAQSKLEADDRFNTLREYLRKHDLA